MNYFSPATAAQRYSKGRPHFHPNTINHIKSYLSLDQKLNNVLDVACGTGLSTTALLEIGKNVYGTDASAEMLNLAKRNRKINYSLAYAEHQPFGDNFFDLITVSSGVHWFDIDSFLIESNRMLKSLSWLILYENHFIAEMEEDLNFNKWFFQVYLIKYPSPPRNNSYNWTNENLQTKNFKLIKEEIFKNPVSFSKKQLALYFTTQSNIIAAVEKNKSTYQQVDDWLSEQLSPFFENDRSLRTINFGNWIKYIQKAS